MTNPHIPPAPATWPGSQIVLPSRLGELIRFLDDRLAVPAPLSTAMVIQVLSAAFGPSARLSDDPAPLLLAELNTLVVAPAGSTLLLAQQELMAPLHALQDDLWERAEVEPTRMFEPDGATTPDDDLLRQQAVIVLNAPGYAELQAALDRSFDRTVFTVHDAGAWERFWPELKSDRNSSRLQIYLRLLAGCSRLPKQGKPRREIITAFMEARPQSLALHEFIAALPPDLAGRFLAVDLGTAPVTWPAETSLPPTLADQWSDLVRRLFDQRRAGTPQLVTVGDAARRLFHQFHRALLGQVANKPAAEQEIMLHWPTLARRIALVLHQTEDNVNQPIQPAHALAGIALALGYGGQMLTWRGRAERERLAARQLEDRQRLLAKLQRLGETTFRDLYRSFDDQSIARWGPVLDGLLAEGLVVELPDGRISLAEHQLRRLVCV